MLIFLRHNLTFLATPKTGTTAVEMTLRPEAEIIFAKNRKHLTASRYVNKVAPFLEETFGVRPPSVAVMREPVDQIRSWYKYRQQERHIDTSVSTHEITFDQFVREVISDDPPKRAQIGRQFSFLTDGQGHVLVDHIFSHAHRDGFEAFLSDRLGQPVAIPERNVSPDVAASLEPSTLTALKKARPEDFALYDTVMAAASHLKSAQA